MRQTPPTSRCAARLFQGGSGSVCTALQPFPGDRVAARLPPILRVRGQGLSTGLPCVPSSPNRPAILACQTSSSPTSASRRSLGLPTMWCVAAPGAVVSLRMPALLPVRAGDAWGVCLVPSLCGAARVMHLPLTCLCSGARGAAPPLRPGVRHLEPRSGSLHSAVGHAALLGRRVSVVRTAVV